MRIIGSGNTAQPDDPIVKVEVENHLGSLVDLSAYLVSVEYEQTADEIVDAATVVFRRDEGSSSLAPLMTANPPIDVGRDLVVSIDAGSGSYLEVFRGKIDAVDWPQRFGDVTVQCRDQAGVIADTWIESVDSYGSDEGVALETVMQSIATANLASAPTIYIPSATSAVVQPAYEQSQEPVLTAERTLADAIGWMLRWRWIDSLTAWRWTLFEPARAKDTPDHTFGVDSYYDVTVMSQEVSDIRNVVEVEYGEPDEDGVRPSVKVSDAGSIADYGRRYMKIVEASDSPINNSTLATALANAALSDSATPDALLEITAPYFWPGEIGVDLYEFTANNVHFSANQEYAAMALRHRLAVGERPETKILCRGKPSAGVLMWRRRERSSALKSAAVDKSLPEVFILPQVDQVGATASATVSGNRKVASIKIAASTSATPSASTVRAATAIDAQIATPADVGTLLSSLAPDSTLYFAAFGYTGVGGAGTESVLATARVNFGVGSDGIEDGSILEAKLAADAVTRNKILNEAVNDLKLASAAVTNAKLAIDAVDTANIVNAALTEVKISTSAITNTKIADDAITTSKIAALAIESDKIAAGAIIAGKLSAGAIDATNIIADGIITNDLIATGTITGAKLVANTITASQIATGTITGAKLVANTITASQIAALTITADEISANAITAAKISTGAVEAGKIAAGAINSDTLFSGAIITNALLAGSITADKLSVSTLSAIAADIGTVTAGTISGVEVRLDAGASAEISFRNSGTEYATINANTSSHSTSIALAVGSTNHVFVSTSATYFYGDVQLGGFAFGTAPVYELRLLYNSELEFGEKWKLRKGTDANANLDVMVSGTVTFYFKDDGNAYADTSWSTFSPTPPKPAAEMRAGDWLGWACEDACKPNKPYAGLPSHEHPEVRALVLDRKHQRGDAVKVDDLTPDDDDVRCVVEEEIDRYGKDLAKVAIGTARWGEKVAQALADARDFKHFKELLAA